MNNPVTDDIKKRLDSLFEAFSIVAEGTYVYLCDMRCDYSRWSKNAVETFGLPSEYMYAAGGIWEERIHPEDRESYHKSIEDIFSGTDSGHDMQYRAKRLDGEYDVCTCRGVVIRDENGDPEYFGGAIRNHSLQHSVDTLVGLRNQYGFLEDLGRYLIRNKTEMICMIGISKFVEINEIYGYMFGNTVLQKFGRYLYEHVGNRGHVYRLDGTKFAVISSTMSKEELQDRYNELRSHFRDGFELEGKHIILDLSAGLITLDRFEVDVQTVYTCLHYAYNESKLNNRGDLVEFNDELNDDNRQRIEKIHVIRESITRDFEGFCLYYQPVVSAKDESLLGAEALIRWKNDTYGMVMPDEFIPLLELDSLFPDLGCWILETAIIDAKKIMKLCPGFVINVNLSYAQLEKPDFMDTVIDILKRNDFPADHLCLEITERCRLLDVDLLKNILTGLRSINVRFAMDDFGTGFSSIGLLKDLPIDTIKIDRSFVKDIEEDEMQKKLAGNFAHVADIFSANLCVEGIENTNMRDILREYPVKSFQGYLYSKPVDLESFMSLIPTLLSHE